jgi:hypothetical protein
MATLDNILALLDKWPRWKRINDMPDHLDGLLARMSALEERLTKAPGLACKFCGEMASRLTKQARNGDWEEWACEKCGQTYTNHLKK